jgi:hypothetical protein
VPATITLGKPFAEYNTWQIPLGKKSVGKAVFTECFLSGTQQRQSLKRKKTEKNCKKIFYQERPPSASAHPSLSKSQVAAFFARYVAGGIRTRNLSLTHNPYTATLQCHLCLDSVLVPTYYTKLTVNCLFEALNEFKSKRCQQQRFITFRDQQLLFRKFLHPKSFTKFEFQI